MDLFVLWEVIKTVAMWFVLNVKCFKIVNMFSALDRNVPLYHLITEEKTHGWHWFSRREMNVRGKKKCVILRGFWEDLSWLFWKGIHVNCRSTKTSREGFQWVLDTPIYSQDPPACTQLTHKACGLPLPSHPSLCVKQSGFCKVILSAHLKIQPLTLLSLVSYVRAPSPLPCAFLRLLISLNNFTAGQTEAKIDWVTYILFHSYGTA